MSLLTPTGVPAASGYPQYSGSLIHPMFGMELIEQFYCSTIFGEITTTDYIGELARCGDQITFWRAPQVTIDDHIKDGPIKHQTLEAKNVTLTIDRAKQFSIKLADVDERQMCNIEQFKTAMLDSAARAAAESIDCDVLSSIYACADRYNRGANAGIQSHCFNLGSVGDPLVLDETNIYDFLIALGAVLNEQCVPRQDRWIVVPAKFEYLLQKAGLCSVCNLDVSQNSALNGRLMETVNGFRIYVSHNVSTVIDPGTNQLTYNLIAGWKGSAVFASQLETTRIITDKDSWDHYYQGLMVYGFGVIQPTGLIHAYVTFA